MLLPPTSIAVVLHGIVIISARGEAHSPLRATRSKALKIHSFFPVGGAASFTAAIPSRRELTRFTSCLLKRLGSKRLAATWRSRSMEDRLPTWTWWTTPEGMTLQPRRYSQVSRARATERFIWISPLLSHS